MQQAANTTHRTMTGGVPDTRQFIAAGRIHAPDSAIFVNPQEIIERPDLDPRNEAVLRQKLARIYRYNEPSFLENPQRQAIVLNLGRLVRNAPEAKHSQLLKAVETYNKEVKTGVDAALQQALADKHAPLQAAVREAMKAPEKDPVGIDTAAHGLMIYLLLREKLTRQHYPNSLPSYVQHRAAPDQILGDLQAMIGVTPQAIREAAASGGVKAVGQVLGLEAAFVTQVEQAVQAAQSHAFSDNMLKHWILGYREAPQATFTQQLEAGLQKRIAKAISELRIRADEQYVVPQPARAMQEKIADALTVVLAPIQLKLLEAQQVEISYTPTAYADSIAGVRSVFGAHRTIGNHPNDLYAATHIYLSDGTTVDKLHRLIAHEVAHSFFPTEFTPQEAGEVDALLAKHTARSEAMQAFFTDTKKYPPLVQGGTEQTHFEQVVALHGAYQAGTAEEKAAVIAKTNALYAGLGDLLPHVRDPLHLKHMVGEAYNLRIEGPLFQKGIYDATTTRLREIISRTAELLQVCLRGEPEMRKFVLPELEVMFEKHYLGHLERVYAKLQHGKQTDMPPVSHQTTQEMTQLPASAQTTASDTTPVAASAGAITSAIAPMILQPAAQAATLPAIQETIAASPIVAAPAHGATCPCAACGHKPKTEVTAPVAAHHAAAPAVPAVAH